MIFSGAQAGTQTQSYATRKSQENFQIFNKNPLYGGPKYANLGLKQYEEERERSSINSRSSTGSKKDEPLPIYNSKKLEKKTRRYYVNRYVNLSDFSLDWKENIQEKGYKHPLGLNHTALD